MSQESKKKIEKKVAKKVEKTEQEKSKTADLSEQELDKAAGGAATAGFLESDLQNILRGSRH